MIMQERHGYLVRGIAVTLVVFGFLLFGGMRLLDYIDHSSRGAEEQLVADAVRQAAITCYSVEGAYPGKLSHLTDYYGLAYNEDAFIVSYDAFAENLMPDIHVMRRGDNP